MAADGSFVVTYGRWNPDISKREVFFQRFDGAGNVIGAPIETQSSASGGLNARNEYPDIAMFDNGDFVIAFESTANTIYVESYRKDGTFKGTAYLGGGTTPTIDVTPVFNSNGTSIVVAWESDSGGDILFQRFDSNLNRLGSIATADTTSKNNDKPSIALDAAGNFAISWTEVYDANTSDWDIRYRQFSADGVPLTSGSQPADVALSIQNSSSIAMSNDGRFVIANESTDSPDRLREFTATGAQIGSMQEFPGAILEGTEVAMSGNGKHMVLAFKDNPFNGKPSVWVFQSPNQTPTDIQLNNTAITENQAANTTVGFLTTIDADLNDTFVYSLVDGTGSTDNAEFNIVGNALQARQSLNFELKNSYSIRVRTNDGYGGIFDKQFAITVRDVAEQSQSNDSNDSNDINEPTDIIGSAANDILVGNSRDNFILGKGGKDRLTGGAGADQFVFDINARFNARVMRVDVVVDFVRGVDRIVLDRTTFTKLKGSALKSTEFASVKNAQQARKSRALITYVRSTGSLFYNENAAKPGFGAGGQFADLSDGLLLSRSDISVIA